jgi:hypothetical protein
LTSQTAISPDGARNAHERARLLGYRERAQTDVEEVSSLANKIQPLIAVERQVADYEVLVELAASEEDQATAHPRWS